MINKDLIKKLRSERSWSQEHLALVSDISLRTVQRVENEGKCSMESKKALAAVFELDVTDLETKSATTALGLNDSRRESVISWLEIVDSGEYTLSWQEAAPLFQNRISDTKWVEMLTQVRTPFGKVISRSIKKVSEHDALPGAPDGQYMVITLKTSYERKKSSIETVTLNKTNDRWRVAGYFIK